MSWEFVPSPIYDETTILLKSEKGEGEGNEYRCKRYVVLELFLRGVGANQSCLLPGLKLNMYIVSVQYFPVLTFLT